ncbi:MAG: hypothetical protein ACXVJB_13600 [Mucilaginibacter sp.]
MEKLAKSIKYPAIIVMMALGFSSCKKNGVAPSAAKAPKAVFGIQSTNAAAILPASTAGVQLNTVSAPPQIMWTSGIANITKFKFEAKRAGVKREFESSNLMNVDLFAISPSLISTPIDSGTYKEIEVKVELTQSADTSAMPLKLKGTFTNSQGVAIPVELDLNATMEIKAEAKDVVVSASQNLQTIFLLNLNKISMGITGSDLDAATQTAGVIVISRTSNANLFNTILQNVSNIGDTKMEVEQGEGGDDSGSGHGSGHSGDH